jgi:hypothetical protein
MLPGDLFRFAIARVRWGGADRGNEFRFETSMISNASPEPSESGMPSSALRRAGRQLCASGILR